MTLPRLIDVEELFADPIFSGAGISPDGTRLAYLSPKYGRTQVWIRGIDQEHEDAICVTHDSRRGVKGFIWTKNPRYMLYLQDTDGNEDWRLYRVNLEAPEAAAVPLTPDLPPLARVLGVQELESLPGKLLVTMNPRIVYIDLYEIDLETGESKVYLENPTPGGAYIVGRNGELFQLELNPDDGAWEWFSVDEQTQERRLIASFEGTTYPVGQAPSMVAPDGKAMIIGAYVGDDLALLRCDAETGEQTVLLHLPGRNICTASMVSPLLPSSIFVSEHTGELLAVRFTGDKPHIEVVDEGFKKIYEALSALSDGVLAHLTSDKDENLWVASFTHDREPDKTYLYDARSGESRLLFNPFPNLDPADMAPMQGVRFNARDGLPLHGFLTLPVGVEPSGLPLVLYVHGGPWFHDSWMFNRIAQFFANRGYAVLQVNFRGSSGYGKNHLVCSVKELAGKMHDDLIDACDWAVKQGYADPSRIGIYGGSYGGYSALVGVTVTPDYFAAAVDYVGISSLPNFLKTLPAMARPTIRNNWLHWAGDPEDPEQLADMQRRSPITMVDKIVTPLLVVQGAKDSRVVQEEADNIVAALRARDVDVEYILAEDEGHGFQNPENNMRMYRAVEKHFAKYLGGRAAS
ncbi:MAG TPA: alpha/beta fold hydrolase [Mycobacteriales bacterium]|nr:alpha/beta fold hydrolase [Mycobacteriales bacterium]